MTSISIRASRPDDGARILAIWARAVDATHDFLDPADRIAIGDEVAAFLPHAPLWVAADPADDRPLGFMLLDAAHMEALFIDPDWRGRGIGRALVAHALSLRSAITTDVNAQNVQAVGFYERQGFVPTGRSETDGQGRPYPLIHLRCGA